VKLPRIDTIQGPAAFSVRSGGLCASDPGYQDEEDDFVLRAVNGTWFARAGIHQESPRTGVVAYLHVWHEGRAPTVLPENLDDLSGNPDFHYLGENMLVDSGQAGFFDDESFSGSRSNENWYDGVCRMTADARMSTVGFGAVCSAGYGDGAYPIIVALDGNDKVIEAVVPFVFEEDEDDETDTSEG
jgi:hypothetical protein